MVMVRVGVNIRVSVKVMVRKLGEERLKIKKS